jgi:hypothetical protein
MNKKILSILIIACSILLVSESYADWLIYHKPEFKGKVIDKETKEPIEGAVIAVDHTKESYDILGHGSPRCIHVEEMLTDANGEFVVPSYVTIISPFSISRPLGLIIYKPGYGHYPRWAVTGRKSPEVFFTKEKAGLKGEIMSGGIKYTFTYGVIELPRLSTYKLRKRASMISYDYPCDEESFPLLKKTMEKEEKWLRANEPIAVTLNCGNGKYIKRETIKKDMAKTIKGMEKEKCPGKDSTMGVYIPQTVWLKPFDYGGYLSTKEGPLVSFSYNIGFFAGLPTCIVTIPLLWPFLEGVPERQSPEILYSYLYLGPCIVADIIATPFLVFKKSFWDFPKLLFISKEEDTKSYIDGVSGSGHSN